MGHEATHRWANFRVRTRGCILLTAPTDYKVVKDEALFAPELSAIVRVAEEVV